MKLILSLTLLWAFSSTAGALQCRICRDLTCTTTEATQCTIETACITSTILVTTAGVRVPQVVKGCAPPPLCSTLGTQTLSANLSSVSAVASVECCNSDNCNLATLPFPADQSENRLECFTCRPGSIECNSTVRCIGVQDRCFDASVPTGVNTSIPVKGCMSENLCSTVSSLSNIPALNFNRISCCNNSLCNNAPTTTTTTTVYLLFGFIYFLY